MVRQDHDRIDRKRMGVSRVPDGIAQGGDVINQ